MARISIYTLILTTFFVALLLDVYPLPLEYRILRPQFVLIVAIYWIYVLPQSTSMFLLLLLGVGQDVVLGSPLGQHPLMLILVCYLCQRTYRRVRHFAQWQEVLWIFLLVGLAQLLAFWVQGLAGRQFSGMEFLLPALSSATVWLLLSLVLNALRRRYRISRQI